MLHAPHVAVTYGRTVYVVQVNRGFYRSEAAILPDKQDHLLAIMIAYSTANVSQTFS